MNRISFYGEQRYCSLRNNTNLRVVLLKFKVDITRVLGQVVCRTPQNLKFM